MSFDEVSQGASNVSPTRRHPGQTSPAMSARSVPDEEELAESWRVTERCQKALSLSRSEYDVVKTDLQLLRQELRLAKRALATQTDLTRTREHTIAQLQERAREAALTNSQRDDSSRSSTPTATPSPSLLANQSAVVSLRAELLRASQQNKELHRSLAEKTDEITILNRRLESRNPEGVESHWRQRCDTLLEVERSKSQDIRKELNAVLARNEKIHIEHAALLQQEALQNKELHRSLAEKTDEIATLNRRLEIRNPEGVESHWRQRCETLLEVERSKSQDIVKELSAVIARNEKLQIENAALIRQDAERARLVDTESKTLAQQSNTYASQLAAAEARASEAEAAYARDTSELRNRLEKHRHAEAEEAEKRTRLFHTTQSLVDKAKGDEQHIANLESALQQREDREVTTLADLRVEHAAEIARLKAVLLRAENTIEAHEASRPSCHASTMTREDHEGYTSLEKTLSHKQMCMDECVKENNTLIVRLRSVQDELEEVKVKLEDVEAESADKQIILQMEKNELQNKILFLESSSGGNTAVNTTPLSTELFPSPPPQMIQHRTPERLDPRISEDKEKIKRLEQQVADLESAGLLTGKHIKESINHSLGHHSRDQRVDVAGLYDTICLLDKRNRDLEGRLNSTVANAQKSTQELKAAEAQIQHLSEENSHLSRQTEERERELKELHQATSPPRLTVSTPIASPQEPPEEETVASPSHINLFVKRLTIGKEEASGLADPKVRDKILALAEQIRDESSEMTAEDIQKETSGVSEDDVVSLKKQLQQGAHQSQQRDAVLAKLKQLAVSKIGGLEGELKRLRKQVAHQDAKLDASQLSAARYKASAEQLQSELKGRRTAELYQHHTRSSMPSPRLSLRSNMH